MLSSGRGWIASLPGGHRRVGVRVHIAIHWSVSGITSTLLILKCTGCTQLRDNHIHVHVHVALSPGPFPALHNVGNGPGDEVNIPQENYDLDTYMYNAFVEDTHSV